MNTNELTQILKLLSERPIAYYPAYARITGSVTAGVFLSQCVYWASRTTDPDGWWYMTYDGCHRETYLSRREWESARKSLIELGLLSYERRGLPAKGYYRIHWERLLEQLLRLYRTENPECTEPPVQIVQNVQSGMDTLCNPESPKLPIINLTETTTETTAETTAENESHVRNSDERGAQNQLYWEQFRKLYPSRGGRSMAWAQAKQKFLRLIKNGISPECCTRPSGRVGIETGGQG